MGWRHKLHELQFRQKQLEQALQEHLEGAEDVSVEITEPSKQKLVR